jgi:hypothetical protein
VGEGLRDDRRELTLEPSDLRAERRPRIALGRVRDAVEVTRFEAAEKSIGASDVTRAVGRSVRVDHWLLVLGHAVSSPYAEEA